MEYQEVKDYYENLYESQSDQAFPSDRKRYLSWFTEVLPVPRKGARSLDIGCGVGHVCDWLQKEGYEAHGNDISDEALSVASKNIPSATFTRSLESGLIESDDDAFDLVTCLGVLEHIKPQQKVIDEAFRVLNQGGRAVFIVPNSANPYFWLGGTGQILEVPHSLRVWKKMFEKSGFKVEKIRRDPGPTWRSEFTVGRKIKLILQGAFNVLPVSLTYQFIFFLRKAA